MQELEAAEDRQPGSWCSRRQPATEDRHTRLRQEAGFELQYISNVGGLVHEDDMSFQRRFLARSSVARSTPLLHVGGHSEAKAFSLVSPRPCRCQHAWLHLHVASEYLTIVQESEAAEDRQSCSWCARRRSATEDGETRQREETG